MKAKQILPSEAAATLGSIKTAKKAASSAANGKRRGLLPLNAFTCTCAQCPAKPKTYCPRGRALIRRQRAQQANDMKAVIEYSKIATDAESFAILAAQKRKKLHALMTASETERKAALKKSATVAAAFYVTPEGMAELADWRAIQSEPFHE